MSDLKCIRRRIVRRLYDLVKKYDDPVIVLEKFYNERKANGKPRIKRNTKRNKKV